VHGVPAEALKAHPIFAPLAKFAHARGASSEQLQEVLAEVAAEVQKGTPKPEEEMKKLGENAVARVTALSGWLAPIVAAKPEFAARAAAYASDAVGVELLEVLMAQAKGTTVEKVTTVPVETGDSQAEIEKLMATEGYFRGTDKAVVERVQRFFQRKSAAK